MKGLELYDIARYLGVPQEIIDAKPDDGLGISGGDEDQLGAAYPILDKTLINLVQKGFDVDGAVGQLDDLPGIDGVPDETVRRLAERVLRGAHKRRGTKNLSRGELGLPDLSSICTKKRIAIYGGSFNPPGLHHHEVAKEIAKRFDLVIVYPCGRRSDKPSTNLVGLEHRKEMARIAFAGLPNTQLDLYDLENDVYTPTYYLQERYEKIFEDAELWYVVGTDLVAGGKDGNSDIEKNWTYGKIIWQTLNFAVIMRPGYAVSLDDLPPSSELIEFQQLVSSGTMIRERIGRNEPFGELVSRGVAKYIKKHGLYADH
jgi:nicotinate (nicotinamide) nucleotide adenylyltransferase